MRKDPIKKVIKLKWECMYSECKNMNYRVIERGHVIFEDYCDACKKLTHEPITKVISSNG